MDVPNNDGSNKIEHISWDKLDKRKYYVLGPTFMVGVRLLIFPPILIKTRLQVQQNSALYTGTFDAFKKIFKSEGIRGFYKGFATSNLSIISGQVYITMLEVVRSKLPNLNGAHKSLIAGFCASLAAQTITVPVDIISQKQMMNINKKVVVSTITEAKSTRNQTAWTVILDIYRKYGLRGFYKGYLASLLTYTPSSAIWWASYYSFTQLYGNMVADNTPVIVIQGLSGPSASAVAAVITNPADTIRTRLQVEGGSSSIGSVALKLYKEEGIRALHKGLTARLASSLPSGFIIIVGYESVKRLSLKPEYTR